MRRRELVYIPVVLVFAAAFAIPAVVAKSKSGDTARAGDASWHRVDLHWKPDALDILRPNPIILDTIDSFGLPFGFNRPGEMRTPRSQIGTDQRSGKWRVFLTRGNNPGSCFGTFALDRHVVKTTATYQIVKYDGAARLGGCRGVRKFQDVVPGRLGALTGRTVCRVRGCDGGLDIKGNIRY